MDQLHISRKPPKPAAARRPAAGVRRQTTNRPLIAALDGRDHDADALALARTLRAALGGGLVIAHVIPPAPLGRGMTEYALLARREGRELLARAAEEFGAASQTRLLETWPLALALAELAEDHDASMIVLGPSHRGTVGSAVPGRAASRLLARTTRPVAVAPPGYADTGSTSISTIGVAYDGTTGSDLALAAAIGAASKLGVPLRLYHAMHQISGDPSWDLYRKSMQRVAQQILERGLRQVPSELVATTRVLEGDAVDVIADASGADDIALLYVGSRRYGPLREAMVGGVVGGLLHGARCPLVIVPEGGEG